MPNQKNTISNTFRALADPTRRAVIEKLSYGTATVSELAAPVDMALPSFLQHLKVLEDNGLIISHKVGRVRTCELVPATLAATETWIAERRRLLETHLDALEQYLSNGTTKNEQGGKPS